MIPVQRISHATYETPDLARQIDYYVEVAGLRLAERARGRAILCTRLGEEALVLETGASARCSKVAFALDPLYDIARVAPALAPRGIRAELRHDITPAVAAAAAFEDPKGTLIELFTQAQTADPVATQGIAPLKLGHLAHVVADAKALTDFYVACLGFRVSDWMEDFFSFLRCGPDHHTVNFRTGDKSFMHHIAFELTDWAHLGAACEVLGRHKRPILWGPLRHGIGHNLAIYHRDPDDHIIEFYAELDQMKSEALGYFEPRPWHEDRPQRPKVWKREAGPTVWGVPPAPDYLRSRPPMPGH
jgi:catechol-2,3-dioxygenase